MVIDRRKATLFGVAVALRLLLCLAFPSLPDLLTGRVEISTPVTSFKRREHFYHSQQCQRTNADFACTTVKEGLFLYTHNLSPYDGGVFHQVRALTALQ